MLIQIFRLQIQAVHYFSTWYLREKMAAKPRKDNMPIYQPLASKPFRKTEFLEGSISNTLRKAVLLRGYKYWYIFLQYVHVHKHTRGCMIFWTRRAACKESTCRKIIKWLKKRVAWYSKYTQSIQVHYNLHIDVGSLWCYWPPYWGQGVLLMQNMLILLLWLL